MRSRTRSVASKAISSPRKLAVPQRAAPAASPVVKWVGGKSKLLPELRARMPETIGRYYEPFAGGAALFFATVPRDAVLADDNKDLIATYRAIREDVDLLVRKLEIHRDKHDERHYYGTRAAWNDPSVSMSAVDRAATFIYLNKTCFNGLWRVNRSGAFNVPMGRYTDPPICVPETLRTAAIALARADLRHTDFREAVADASRGDFVYFDPPYDPLTKTANFTSYTAGAFTDDDQRELAELAKALIARGVRVMLSNSDTPFIRSIYKGLKLDRVKCARAINSDASRRGEVDEIVATGGY